MIHEAWLFNKDGMPIWNYIISPSELDEALIGTIIGALTIFSTEFTGKHITGVEMENKKFHVKVFDELVILVLYADNEDIINPKLLNIVNKLESAIGLLKQPNTINMNLMDEDTIKFYLNDIIQSLEKLMDESGNNTPEQKKKISLITSGMKDKLEHLSSSIRKDGLGVLILDEKFNEIAKIRSEEIEENDLDRAKFHVVGWLNAGKLRNDFFPNFVFTKRFCIGVKTTKGLFIICMTKWEGSIGNQKELGKIKSWLAMVGRILV